MATTIFVFGKCRIPLSYDRTRYKIIRILLNFNVKRNSCCALASAPEERSRKSPTAQQAASLIEPQAGQGRARPAYWQNKSNLFSRSTWHMHFPALIVVNMNPFSLGYIHAEEPFFNPVAKFVWRPFGQSYAKKNKQTNTKKKKNAYGDLTAGFNELIIHILQFNYYYSSFTNCHNNLRVESYAIHL